MIKDNTIENLRELFEGRRVDKVEQRVYPPDDNGLELKADYPVFYLDDGSEVIVLDDDGNPPIAEREKEPWGEPALWHGDQA